MRRDERLTRILQQTADAAAEKQQRLGPFEHSTISLVRNMKDSVALLRYHWYSQIAMLIPGTTDIQIINRARNGEHKPPYWLPEIVTFGYFDLVGGTLLALYRTPPADSPLVLQLDSSTITLNGSVRTSFEPEFTDGEPLIENSDVERRFTLTIDGATAVDRTYSLNDREKRLYFSIDPFPSSSGAETDYDLLYLVHRVMTVGSWPKVLRIRDGNEAPPNPSLQRTPPG